MTLEFINALCFILCEEGALVEAVGTNEILIHVQELRFWQVHRRAFRNRLAGLLTYYTPAGYRWSFMEYKP